VFAHTDPSVNVHGIEAFLCRKKRFAKNAERERRISPFGNPLSKLNVESARGSLRAFKAPQKDSARGSFAAQEENAPRSVPTNETQIRLNVVLIVREFHPWELTKAPFFAPRVMTRRVFSRRAKRDTRWERLCHRGGCFLKGGFSLPNSRSLVRFCRYRNERPISQARFRVFRTVTVHNIEAFLCRKKRFLLFSHKTKPSEKSDGFIFYSVLSATTGSFFAALLEGIIPAKSVRTTLIMTSTIAASQGRNAFRLSSPVK